MMYPKTEELRAKATTLGIYYTTGYSIEGGKRVNEDNVTSLWDAKHGKMVTVEESMPWDLYLVDPVDIDVVLGLVKPAKVGERPPGKDAMRRWIVAGLEGLDLDECADSHGRLSAICSAIYRPRNGWTPGACKGLVRRICLMLGAGAE